MGTMRRMTISALAVVGSMGLASCGDDGGGTSASPAAEERAAYVDAVVESSGDESYSDEENRCVAEAYVDVIGLDELRGAAAPDEIRDSPDSGPYELGIELDEARATVLYDALNHCVDLRRSMIDRIVADEQAPEVATACIEEQLDDDLVRDVMVLLITQGNDALAQPSGAGSRYVEALTSCALEPLDGGT